MDITAVTIYSNVVTIRCCLYITELVNNSSSIHFFNTNIKHTLCFSLCHFFLLLNTEYSNCTSESAIRSLYIPLQRDTETGDKTGKEFYQISLSSAPCHSLNTEYVSCSGSIPALHSDVQKNNQKLDLCSFLPYLLAVWVGLVWFFFVQCKFSPSCICKA